ncbi:hypothetical protein RF11_12549 [Thelohanellus kitauei]|uniref:Uncharacterized protein n=1 Tax=Thelohanellus kitauei TaxID=669202 RepID=A0A0C2NB64_THEKT|nr:hypothetical protein RF11_12549 [Thelohanellus kitauei]
MDLNFDAMKFVVSERHKFCTELKRRSGEILEELASSEREKAAASDFAIITDFLDESLKTGFICAVNHETAIKAVFHRSSGELTFVEVVEIAGAVEHASKVDHDQIDSGVENIFKIS